MSPESADSISHHQAVMSRRLDEQAQISQANEQQLRTAATVHAAHFDDAAASTQQEASAQLHHPNTAGAAHRDLVDQVQHNTAAVIPESKPVHTSADKPPAQHKLGSQITLALQRHGKGSQALQQTSSTAETAQKLSADLAMQTLPRAAPGPTEAPVSLYPKDGIEAAASPARHTHDLRPSAVSHVAVPRSKSPCQPVPVTQYTGPSAAALLQSMANQAAPCRAGMHSANIHSSPVPSIDRFSSMSSWGASTIPTTAVSRAIDSILTLASDSTDNCIQAALPADQPSDGMRATDASITIQQTQGKGAPLGQKSKSPAQYSKPVTGGVCAMHDSSSSWSNRSNVTKSGDLDSPARILSKSPVSKMQMTKKASPKCLPARADAHSSGTVTVTDRQGQAPSNKHMPAGNTL